MTKITCRHPFKCRLYDICHCELKDKEPEKCKVRFDYEFQSQKNKIFGFTFIKINEMQQGVKNNE